MDGIATPHLRLARDFDVPAIEALMQASIRAIFTRTAVLLVSFLARPILAMALGLGAYFLLPHLKGHELSLLVWGAVFYLILLAVESRVVSRRESGATAGR